MLLMKIIMGYFDELSDKIEWIKAKIIKYCPNLLNKYKFL